MIIEHRQLAHCRTLASHGHFGRAAEALGITQPALTRIIQNLERSLRAFIPPNCPHTVP
jgi:DNA-binding transcriptional LysR family regulator